MKPLVFDLDGTLVDSLHDIADATNGALADHGLPTHSLEAIRSFVGHGIVHLIRCATPPGADFEQVLASARARYADNPARKSRPFPKIAALVERLRGEGRAMAVLTNKPHHLALEVVDKLFGDAFVRTLGEGPVPPKPKSEGVRSVLETLGAQAQQCIFIGDSPVDVETARRVSMPVVAVSWGFSSRATLLEAKPDTLVDTVDELALALG